ncbi:MAG: hypothetical protein NT150_01425 [Bacteroidetes bacterium]|nr:hypothetical protein [Bacteroidota bacterium]
MKKQIKTILKKTPLRLLISFLGIALMLLDLFHFETLFLEDSVLVLVILVFLIHTIHFGIIKRNTIIKIIYLSSLIISLVCFLAYWGIMMFGAGYEGRSDDEAYLMLLAIYSVGLVVFNFKDYK